jgi:serralysin
MPAVVRACVPRPRYLIHAAPPHADRMAAQTAAVWRPGTTLHVAFDSASIRAQRLAVMRAAAVWMEHANVRFVQVANPAPTAELRIAFDPGGSWSYIGRECALVPANEPTGNMGWPDDPGRDLHELGHALGLIHEHQWGSIPWNREACYAFYGAPPNSWSRQEVDEQVLDRADPATLTTSGKWDKNSIMEYPIPADLVLDPRFATGWNQTLSPIDVAMITRLYPR